MRFLLVILSILLLLLFTSFLGWKSVVQPVNKNDSTSYEFLITKGQNVKDVATKLEKQGFVKNALAFRLYSRLSGQDKMIQPGEYRLSPSLTLKQIMETFVAGPQELWVTYPEGLRREEIALKTVKSLQMKENQAKEFITIFLQESEGKEGFLFPDTYLFPRDTSAPKVVAKLADTFNIKVTHEVVNEAKSKGLDVNELISLASILEKETKAQERPIVAGILLKRLAAGWPLQTDASLQYIVGTTRCKTVDFSSGCDWWKPPTREDKQLNSPYNTYLNKGIPPHPISNPGLSAIKAVVNPQDSEYWFYLHGIDGKVHYAKDAVEHAQNIQKYL